MKATITLLICAITLYSCKDVKKEYKECLMKASNQYMVSGERAKMDDLKEMCNHFDDDLKKMDIDEKNQIRSVLDSIMLNIETKTLFEGIDDAKFIHIPCASDFNVEYSKIINDLPPHSDDAVISQKINYVFAKRPIKCRALVQTLYKPQNGYLDLECKMYDEETIYRHSFRLRIPEKHKDEIKPKTYGRNGGYVQEIEFEGVFNYWFENQYGYSGFVIDVTNFKLMDYE